MSRSGPMSRKALSEPTLSLDRDRGLTGLPRRLGYVHDIDWNRLLLGKKVPTDQDLADAGLDAPRNSLESSPGNRTPRFSGVKQDDVPYGFEIPKSSMSTQLSESAELSAHYHRSSGESSRRRTVEVLPIKTLIAQDFSEAEHERKRRSAPSVVARLMGLDTLPGGGDKSSKSSSSAKPPKLSKKRSPKHHHHPSKGESSRGRVDSSLEEVDTIRDFPLPKSGPHASDSDIFEDKSKFDILPFRSHPQEKQLQEFKKEFMAKLANQSHELPHAAFDRELEERRRQLREKVCEAKLALVAGGDDSRRLSSAQEKLIESKEFQDAIELLQTNREFFLKFFQEPTSVLSKDPPEAESTSRRSFHFEDYSRDFRRSSQLDESSREPRKSFHLGDLSKESRKSFFLDDVSKESPRKSFHLEELSRESRRSLLHELPKNSSRRSYHLDDLSREPQRSPNHMDDAAKEIRALEDNPDSQRLGKDHHYHPEAWQRESKHRSSSQGAKSVAEDGAHDGNRSSSVDKGLSSWVPPPDSCRNVSPNNFDARKGSLSPSRIVVLKPGPGDISLLNPGMALTCSPRPHRVPRDSRAGASEAQEVAREPEDRVDRIRQSEDWDTHPREEKRDPRAIARNIVREARTVMTREISRERDCSRRDHLRVGDANLKGSSGSAGERIFLPKEEMENDSIEAVGSFTLAALSRRCTTRDEHTKSYSSIAPTASPRIRLQETATTSSSSHKEGRHSRRSSEKYALKSVHHVEPIEEYDQESTSTVRKTTTEVDTSRVGISRPRTFSPSLKTRADPFLQSQLLPDDWKGVDVNLYSRLPSTEKILTVESFYHRNHNLWDNSSEISRTFSRCRSISNAAMVGTKFVGAGSSANRVPEVLPDRNLERFYLKEKRIEARLSSKTESSCVDASASARGCNQIWSRNSLPTEECTVVQDVHTVSCKNIEIKGPVEPVPVAQQQHVSLGTRPSFENAVPIQATPRHAPVVVRACEQEPLEALSQLKSQIKDSSDKDHQFRKPSSHKMEVPNIKQATKPSKAWTIATESMENADGDGASETSVEKCGQPSPVSVLDSPFEAEISSPVEFQELTSDLQDLRLKLRILKLDGSDRSRALLESLQSSEEIISQQHHRVVRYTDNSLESTGGSSTSASVLRELRTAPRSQALQFRLESVSVEGIPCPEDRRADLLYVRNLLAASGFTESSTMIIARWHSPSYPLDPALFERLEDYYDDVYHELAADNENAKANKRGASPQAESWNRRLLFDVVNEVLQKLLGPYLSYRPWVQPGTSLLRPIPTNRHLVSDIWREICTFFAPEGIEEFEALDALMSRDYSKGGPRVDSRETVEQIGLELERTIFDALLDEAVQSFKPLRPNNLKLNRATESWQLY